MKRTLIFFGILCMIFFLLFSSADRRTQFLTSLAGPGMLSLVKQASAKATALENFSTDTIAGIPVEESPRIALTFDDGPNARYTPILLDGLKKRNIRASFFLIGENIEGNEDILLQMRKDGHLIGNHTWDHASLSSLNGSSIQSEIKSTNAQIRALTGHNATLVRPPYGAYNSNVQINAGAPLILWSIDTLDWKTRNAKNTINVVMNEVKDGSIILMHDIHSPSVDAAEVLIPKLIASGYQLVTVSELAKYRSVAMYSGGVYNAFYR